MTPLDSLSKLEASDSGSASLAASWPEQTPTLGLHNLTPPSGPAVIQTVIAEPGKAELNIRALSVFTAEQRQANIAAGNQNWLQAIKNSDYNQASRLYRHEYASLLDAQSPLPQLIELIERLLQKQQYKEALTLIRALKRGHMHASKEITDQLQVLKFVTTTITATDSTGSSQPPIQHYWAIAEAGSRQLRSLLMESICIKAVNLLANGQRKPAQKLLSKAQKIIKLSTHSCHWRINLLAKVSSHGRADRIQSNILKRLGKIANVKYYEEFACAIDSVTAYGNGKVIVINGWHINAHNSPISISLAHHSRVLTAHPQLLKRYPRPDLASIEQRYGLGPNSKSSFTCTLLLEEADEITKTWDNGTLVEVLIGNEATLTRLFSNVSIQELTLSDTRKVVSQIIGSNLEPRDYVAGKAIKAIWKERIKTISQQEARHHSFGSNSLKPDISILIPLYGRLDFMEFQLHWFFYSQRRRKYNKHYYQIVYCLDDPDQEQALLRIAEKCSMLYKIPFEIVINPANLGYAGANNMAARYAKADTLLLLNSDIIPRDDDAIDILIDCYQSMPNQKGVLGAKLLYPSNDIQHVGMTFYKDSNLPGILGSCWLNEHPHKHIKHISNSKLQTGMIETEAATAACLLISKDLFDKLDGFRLDYISGDFEDSDLCLRVRKTGRSVTVCLDAVFYHLERQSMALHSNYDQEALKLVAFNAYTHHEYHASTIERLKSMLVSSDMTQDNTSFVQS